MGGKAGALVMYMPPSLRALYVYKWIITVYHKFTSLSLCLRVSLQKVDHCLFNLVADASEIIQVIGDGRVGETMMNTLPLAKPYRALLGCRVADCHDHIEIHLSKLIGFFGCACMQDADLG